MKINKIDFIIKIYIILIKKKTISFNVKNV
jgi:hypothetical protein